MSVEECWLWRLEYTRNGVVDELAKQRQVLAKMPVNRRTETIFLIAFYLHLSFNILAGRIFHYSFLLRRCVAIGIVAKSRPSALMAITMTRSHRSKRRKTLFPFPFPGSRE